MKAGKKGKAKTDKSPSTITGKHVLSLFELYPSVLRSSRVASVEKFIAHQHLYNLPAREERVQMLEERFEQQNKVLSISASKSPATGTSASLSLATSQPPSSPIKDTSASIDKNGISPTRNKGIELEGSSSHPPLSAGKTKDLAFELFPEITAANKSNSVGDNAASPVKKQKKEKTADESGSSGDENEVPLARTAGSVTAPRAGDTGASTSRSKEVVAKEKLASERLKKELQRGRFGIWKLLTGILEGGTAGNQSSHRFQNQSVM